MNSLLSLQVGLRLYDDLNERMSREEATRIRDFVTTEALKVSLRNKTKCTGKIAFKTCLQKFDWEFRESLNFLWNSKLFQPNFLFREIKKCSFAGIVFFSFFGGWGC